MSVYSVLAAGAQTDYSGKGLAMHPLVSLDHGKESKS